MELLLAMEKWNAEGRPGSRLVFTTPKEFFAQFESDAPRLFDFKQTLRGRDTQIATLNTFVADPAPVVGVLAGRGGIGKSKLLHDWAQTVKDSTVLYVREDADPAEIKNLAICLSRFWVCDLAVSFEVCGVPVRIIVSRGFVPICPKKSPKMGVEFPLHLCKKEVLKILGTLPVYKLNLRKG